MTAGAIRHAILTAAGALALAACTSTSPTSTSISPTLRPDQPSTGSAARPQPSEASRALSDYYSRIQQNYLAQGLLRVDGGGPDTPFTERQLVANFIQIALFTEFTNVGGRMVRNETETELHRWEGPIRMKAHFGSTVPLENRQNDEAQLERFAARLSRITGLPISLSDQAPNFHIFILNEDERRVLGPDLRAISSEIVPEVVNIIENMRQTDYCLALGIIGDRVGIYEQAVIVIRAEHPDLLRLSCIHEELAQGLGLPNDSPLARPSVFNDDEEFGLLTTHDEYLLRMLYDRRMRPGMTAAEARPVARQIAAELLSGSGPS